MCVALVPASCSHDVAYALFRSMFSKEISPVELKSLKAEWIARRTQLYCDDQSSVARSDSYKASSAVLKERRPINKAFSSKPIIPDDALIALGAFDCGLGESLQRKCLTKLSRKNAPKVCENYYGGDFSHTCETGRKLIIEQIDRVFYRHLIYRSSPEKETSRPVPLPFLCLPCCRVYSTDAPRCYRFPCKIINWINSSNC